MTTQGMGEAEMARIGRLLGTVLKQTNEKAEKAEGARTRHVREAVVELTGRFPPYPEQLAP